MVSIIVRDEICNICLLSQLQSPCSAKMVKAIPLSEETRLLTVVAGIQLNMWQDIRFVLEMCIVDSTKFSI